MHGIKLAVSCGICHKIVDANHLDSRKFNRELRKMGWEINKHLIPKCPNCKETKAIARVEYTGNDPKFIGLKGNLMKIYSLDDSADIIWDNGEYSSHSYFFRTIEM